jgi:hypothetical protein
MRQRIPFPIGHLHHSPSGSFQLPMLEKSSTRLAQPGWPQGRSASGAMNSYPPGPVKKKKLHAQEMGRAGGGGSCPAWRKTFHTAQKMDDHLACESHSNKVEHLLKLPHAVHRLSKTEIEWLSRNHKNGDRQPQTPPRSNRTFDKVEAGIETRASNLQLSLQGDTQALSEELESMKRDHDQRDSLEPWPQLQRLRESGAAPAGKSFCKACGKMMQSQFSFRQHIAPIN